MDSTLESYSAQNAVDGDWTTLAYTQNNTHGARTWWKGTFKELSCIQSVTLISDELSLDHRLRMDNMEILVLDTRRGVYRLCGKLVANNFFSIELEDGKESYSYYDVSCTEVHCGDGLELRVEDPAEREVSIQVKEILAYKERSRTPVFLYAYGMYSLINEEYNFDSFRYGF